MRRWSFAPIACLVAGVSIACGPDMAVPGYHTNGATTKTNLTIDPAPFMEQVGCVPVVGRADTGAMAIPLRHGPAVVFNCRGVSDDSTRAARLRYYQAIGVALGYPHMTAGYWSYSFIGSREWCWTEGTVLHGQFYKFADAGYWGCFDVDSYNAVWVPASDPDYDPSQFGDGGGGGTDPNAADPLDPIPQEPALESVTLTAGGSTSADVGTEFGWFTATGNYADGSSRELPNDSVAYSSGDASVARLDGDYGAFDAVAAGTTTITGTYHAVSGSAELTVDAPDSPCDRAAQGCLVDLHSSEMDYMTKALALTDTTNPVCAEGLEGEREAFSQSAVYMGATGIPDGTPEHSAITNTVTDSVSHQVFLTDQHFDVDDYDKARKAGTAGLQAFARLMLHEGLHVMGFKHGTNEPDTNNNYSTPPFDLVNPGSPGNGCLRP